MITTTLPLAFSSDIASSFTNTRDYLAIHRDAAYRPASWAAPDSMVAKAAAQQQTLASQTNGMPAQPR